MGGLAGALAYRPFGLGVLIPLAPLGLFLSVRLAARARSAALVSFAGGLVYYGVTTSWLFTTGRYNPMGYAGVPLLFVYLALYPALIAAISYRWFSRLAPLPHFAVYAALWLLAEWFRSLGRLAFPWSMLSHAWARWPEVLQLAEFVGELGVSLIALGCSALILALMEVGAMSSRLRGPLAGKLRRAIGFENGVPEARTPRIGRWAIVLAGLLALAFVGSFIRYGHWVEVVEAVPSEERLRVGALQPNIAQVTKMASYSSATSPEESARIVESIYQTHEVLIDDIEAGSLDLLVLPESTFGSIYFSVEKSLHARFEATIAPLGADVLFGASRLGLDAAGRVKVTEDGYASEVYNSGFFIAGGGRFADALYHDKMRLVPFGEFIPYAGALPFLETAIGLLGFAEGEEVGIFETRGFKHGTMICFESSFGAQARKIANAGAEFLTIITNDGWYGRSAGPGQHHDLAILRAIETRRPVIRAANTGISSIIDPAGRLTATLELGERGVIQAEISPLDHQTFFARWGNLWLVLSSLATLGGAALFAARRRSSMQEAAD